MYASDPHSVRQFRQADLLVSDHYYRHRQWRARRSWTSRARTWWTNQQAPALIDPSHELFAGLSAKTINELAERFTFAALGAGESLARQGETTSEFTVVLEGRIGVTLDGLPVAVFDQGSHFGALPLLDHDLDRFAVASFEALEPTRVAVATAIQFQELMERHPLIAGRVRRVASVRRAYLRGHQDARAMYVDQAHPFPVHLMPAS